MDIEDFVRTNMQKGKSKNETLKTLTSIIQYYKNIDEKTARLFSETV